MQNLAGPFQGQHGAVPRRNNPNLNQGGFNPVRRNTGNDNRNPFLDQHGALGRENNAHFNQERSNSARRYTGK